MAGMITQETGGKSLPTAKRIRQLREAEAYPTATAFAVKLGITISRLSNLENGYPLSIDVADRLVKTVPGLSLDWLYYGKEDGLSLSLRKRLQEVRGTAAKDGRTTRSRS